MNLADTGTELSVGGLDPDDCVTVLVNGRSVYSRGPRDRTKPYNPHRPGRAGRSPLDWATLAARYVEVAAECSNPCARMAAEDGTTSQAVRSKVHKARRAGYITDGAELTALALSVLSDA